MTRLVRETRSERRNAVAYALRTGTLIRQSCWCGADAQAHHANGYDAAHHLDVEWLCTTHHAEAHHGRPD